MATVNIFRGGTPLLRAYYCEDDAPQFEPPFSTPRLRGTPPFNSHADGAHGQGYLNLDFPLVPVLDDTEAHRWMQKGMKPLKNVGDIIRLAWVPQRSYVTAIYCGVTDPDPAFSSVAVSLIAERVKFNFNSGTWVYTEDPDFATAMGTANVAQLYIGDTTQTPYMVKFFEGTDERMATFSHDVVSRDASGNVTGYWDKYGGYVMLGLKVVAGNTEEISMMYRGLYSIHFSAKLAQFEGRTQIG